MTLFSANIFAGNDINLNGARSAGMGFSSVMLSDVWSVSNNQAGLAFLENPSVGLNYRNSFMVNTLGYQALTMAMPIKNTGAFGLNVSYFGYSQYNESQVGLAYGKKLSENFSFGLKVNYVQTKLAEDYGKIGRAVAEAGILAKPTENMFVAAHLYNISRTKIADYTNETIPTIFRIGIGYTFSEKVLVTTEVEKDLKYSPIFKVGIEYQLVEGFFLRTGISTNPTMNSFGIGYKHKRIVADLAFVTHATLGLSSQISINFLF